MDLWYGKVLGKSREAQHVNGKLDKIRFGIEECYSKILKNVETINSSKLKNTFLGLDNDELTFFKFYEKFLSDFEKKVNNGLRVNGILNRYKILLTHLRNFALIRYGYSDLSFKDLTWDCVQEFDYYRRDDHSLNLNFSCFTGLSYSDIKGLKNSNIQEFFDGNQWVIVRRKKTATSSNVMLLDIPKMVIEKYAGLSRDGKVFPVPSNTSCNDSSKRISKLIDC